MRLKDAGNIGLERQRVADMEGKTLSISGYTIETATSDDGREYEIYVIEATADGEDVVVVSTKTAINRMLSSFFRQFPGQTLECVVTQLVSRSGTEYWALVDPDDYKPRDPDELPF